MYHKGKYVGIFGGDDAGWDAAVKAQVHLAPLINWVSFLSRRNQCQNLLSLSPPMLASGTNEVKATGLSKVELMIS